jgi:hypothetical protein
MAFPKSDRQYTHITDAATGTEDTPGGLGAMLIQGDKDGRFYSISYASLQLNDQEKSTHYSYWMLLKQCGEWTFSMKI